MSSGHRPANVTHSLPRTLRVERVLEPIPWCRLAYQPVVFGTGITARTTLLARALALVKDGMGTVETIEAILPAGSKYGQHRVCVKWLHVDSTTSTQLNLQWIEANRLKRNAVLRAYCEAKGWNFDLLVNNSIDLKRPDLVAVGAASESSMVASGTGAPAPLAAAELAELAEPSTSTSTQPTPSAEELASKLNNRYQSTSNQSSIKEGAAAPAVDEPAATDSSRPRRSQRLQIRRAPSP